KVAIGVVADQEFEHHLARKTRSLARGLDLHTRGRLADAGSREHPLALDLDHTGPAIAVRAITGLGQPAEVRDLDALSVGDLPDRFAGCRFYFGPVEEKADRIAHFRSLSDASKSLDKLIHFGLCPRVAAIPKVQELILVARDPGDDLRRNLPNSARRQAVGDDRRHVRYRDRKAWLGAARLQKYFMRGTCAPIAVEIKIVPDTPV